MRLDKNLLLDAVFGVLRPAYDVLPPFVDPVGEGEGEVTLGFIPVEVELLPLVRVVVL